MIQTRVGGWFPTPGDIAKSLSDIIDEPDMFAIPEQTTITRREYIENLLRGRFILQQMRVGHRQPTTEEIDEYVAKHIDDPVVTEPQSMGDWNDKV